MLPTIKGRKWAGVGAVAFALLWWVWPANRGPPTPQGASPSPPSARSSSATVVPFEAEAPKSGPGLLGQVVDSESQPIVGARIEVSDSGPGRARYTETTDAYGRYWIACAPGEWSVRLERAGFLSDSTTADVLPERPTTKNFTLRSSAEVSGYVVDSEGQPVTDAAFVRSRKLTKWRLVEARTGLDGRFRIDAFPGPFAFNVEHPHFQTRSVDTSAPIADLRIVLSRGARIVGTVVDAGRRPLAKVAVSLTDEQQRSQRGWVTETGADGRFELDALPAGSHWISAHRMEVASWRVARQRLELVVPHSQEVTLTIEDGRPIRGRVLDRRSQPVKLVRVVASPEDAPQTAAAMEFRRAFDYPIAEELVAFTNANGEFVIEHANSARYQVSVDDLRYVGEAVVLASPGDRDVALVVESIARVRGRVIDEAGTPITRFLVLDRTWSSRDGRFASDLPSDFEPPLWIHARGYLSASRSILPHEAELDLGDIVLQKGHAVSGRVLAEGSNAPVAGARLFFPYDLRRISPSPAALSGVDGRFSLDGIGEGETRLFVDAEGFDRSVATIPAGVDQPLIYLRKVGIVTGTVPLGVAPRELLIFAHDASGVLEPKASTFHEGNAFRFELPPGRWVLKGGSRSRIIPVEIDVVSGVNRHVEVGLR